MEYIHEIDETRLATSGGQWKPVSIHRKYDLVLVGFTIFKIHIFFKNYIDHVKMKMGRKMRLKRDNKMGNKNIKLNKLTGRKGSLRKEKMRSPQGPWQDQSYSNTLSKFFLQHDGEKEAN